jgi:DNA repair exonuclease SbcCD ATPase subunit
VTGGIAVVSSLGDLDGLRRRVAQLERLVLVLLATSSGDVEGPEIDELLYYLKRQLRSDRPMDRESDFVFLIERLVRSRPAATYRRIDELQSNFEQQLRRADAQLEATSNRLRGEVANVREGASASVRDVRQQLAAVESELDALSKEQHSALALQTIGVDTEAVPLRRYLPVRVYLSDGDEKKVRSVANAITHLLSTFGFAIADDYPAEAGSWWKRWVIRTKEAATQPEVVERVKKIERALELQGVAKPQSEVTKNEAEAAAALIKAVENVPSAAVQAGALLLVKTTSPSSGACVQVRTLNQRELAFLERNQKILASPHEILESLSAHTAAIVLTAHDDEVSDKLPGQGDDPPQLRIGGPKG